MEKGNILFVGSMDKSVFDTFFGYSSHVFSAENLTLIAKYNQEIKGIYEVGNSISQSKGGPLIQLRKLKEKKGIPPTKDLTGIVMPSFSKEYLLELVKRKAGEINMEDEKGRFFRYSIQKRKKTSFGKYTHDLNLCGQIQPDSLREIFEQNN